ncbi:MULTISPECIES: hypothetical protein [Microvirga]|uniref:hypothetical protein n=1 Tax=Microvirga TaxID=186650 RepID=UPI0021C59D29|nr:MULTISPECIES: hypothetical protein [unclassified Microvirga]
MLQIIILACVLAVIMPIVPARGQPNGVLTQANAKVLIDQYYCYSMGAAAAQTVLLKKWFKAIGATDQEFTNFQANAERARRTACGEPPSNFIPAPMGSITARFQNNHHLTNAEAKLTLLDSLERYAKLLASSCGLPTERDLAQSLFVRMRSVSGGPSATPASFDPSNPSAFLGSCGRGGGQVPDISDDIGSWGNSAKDHYRQCVNNVIAKAKPAECVNNPYASQTLNNIKYGTAFILGLVTAATATGPAAPIVVLGAAVTILVTIQIDNANEEQRRKDQENIKKLQEQLAEKEKSDATGSAPASPTATTPSDSNSDSDDITLAPTPVPEDTPDKNKQCSRFPVAGTGYELSYAREDGGVIGILDSIRSCRCEARAVEGLNNSGIAGRIGSECQSDEDRTRADCAQNPFDDHDRPREECIALLLQDNSASVNVEALLCSQVRCSQYSSKVGMSPNRVLACGCLGLSIDGPTRTATCDRMRCEGECVCRGQRCSCEGSDMHTTPPTPPRPPVRPLIPHGLGGITLPPLR